MTIKEIYTYLDNLSPFALQESWDNSGLIVGDWSKEIDTVIISLDIDFEVLNNAPNNSLFIVHHPLIFRGLKQLDYSIYPSNLLAVMIQKNIACIAMHTNFDQTHLNDYVAEKILGYPILEKDGFITYFMVNKPFDNFAKEIQDRLNLSVLKVVKQHQFIEKCALVTGSGASLLSRINADCFLTGDVKYHDAMEAIALKQSIIDIGHYESEAYFTDILQHDLEKLGLSVIISPTKNPFTYL